MSAYWDRILLQLEYGSRISREVQTPQEAIYLHSKFGSSVDDDLAPNVVCLDWRTSAKPRLWVSPQLFEFLLRAGPARQPTEAQAKRQTERHLEKEATRLLTKHAEARRKVSREVDEILRQGNEAANEEVAKALVEVGHMASAPRNGNLYEEHKRNREVAMQVHDLAARTAKVSMAMDRTGNGGAFLVPKQSKSPGLVRQYVADAGQLVGKPINTLSVARVDEKK